MGSEKQENKTQQDNSTRIGTLKPSIKVPEPKVIKKEEKISSLKLSTSEKETTNIGWDFSLDDEESAVHSNNKKLDEIFSNSFKQEERFEEVDSENWEWE